MADQLQCSFGPQARLHPCPEACERMPSALLGSASQCPTNGATVQKNVHGMSTLLAAAYSATDPASQRQTAVLGPLFLMMGRALQRVGCVPAGNVLAIAGV